MKNQEHFLQVACVNWFRLQYPKELIYAIPNGGPRNIITAKKLKAEGVTAGIPDLFVAAACGGYNGIYIELKNGKQGTVSENQKSIIAHLQNKGYKVAVSRSFEDFVSTINVYLSL
jgi:hypothetical protein